MSKSLSIENKIKELQAQLRQAKLDEEKEEINRVFKLVKKYDLQLIPNNELDVELGKIAAKFKGKKSVETQQEVQQESK